MTNSIAVSRNGMYLNTYDITENKIVDVMDEIDFLLMNENSIEAREELNDLRIELAQLMNELDELA